MMMTPTAARSMACLAAGMPACALAAFGPYPHGYGIKSMGMGGLGYVAAEDAYPIAANPAQAAVVGSRLDLGLDWVIVDTGARIENNLLGPDRSFHSHARHFPIPQFGFALPLSARSSLGVSAFAAGLGTHYEHSPYLRFGGDEEAESTIGQSGLSTALTYEILPGQHLGAALNLSYQLLRIKGLGALALLSEDPDHVTDQGFDDAFGIGYSVGWTGRFAETLDIGAAYRSKQWSQRFDDYAGLLADHGRLELPAQFGFGFAWQTSPDWQLAAEIQRLLFAQQRAIGNGIEPLYAGHKLGSANGPGFGWKNQTVYRVGVAWQIDPDWLLRAGYAYGTEPISSRQTLLGALGANTTRDHYCLGFTYDDGEHWELSGYVTLAPSKTVHGEQSIPLLIGGGEADARNGQLSFGLSFGRRFGL